MTEESQNEEGRIDLEKYTGHTPAPWKNVAGDIFGHNEHIADTVLEQVIPQDEAYANTFLIADAPLLLAEVKRLREELRITQSNFSLVRIALSTQYPEIEEAIWEVIE